MPKQTQNESNDTLVMFKGGVLEKGYGIVAKQVMQDTNLNIIAKSLYAYLCTYGPGAFPSRNLVMAHLGIGKDSFHKYMKQLKDYGYISSDQKISNGKFGGNIYTIEQTITPCTIKPDTDKKPKKPCTVSSDAVAPDTVKPDTNSTNINITNSNITKRTTTRQASIAVPVVAVPILNTAKLPKGIKPTLVVKLTGLHGSDAVHRQLKNLLTEQGKRVVNNPAGWLTTACNEGFDSKVELDLFKAQENKELENKLVKRLEAVSSAPHEFNNPEFMQALIAKHGCVSDMLTGAGV